MRLHMRSFSWDEIKFYSSNRSLNERNVFRDFGPEIYGPGLDTDYLTDYSRNFKIELETPTEYLVRSRPDGDWLLRINYNT